MRQWVTNKRFWLLVCCIIATALVLNLPPQAIAEPNAQQETPEPTPFLGEAETRAEDEVTSISWDGFWQTLADIAPVMLLAAVLGGLIAYRHRVTVFEHNLFHAHILLSVAGALMMLIVGNQLVRAFGLLGAASVVRYRYGLRNPRDASMLIIALGIGMATGVQLYALAVSAAVVVFVFSRGLDFFTRRSSFILVVTRPTRLRVRTSEIEATMDTVHGAFAARGIEYRLRRYRRVRKKRAAGTAVYLLDYDVQLSPEDSREQLTAAINAPSVISVRWDTVKPRKG